MKRSRLKKTREVRSPLVHQSSSTAQTTGDDSDEWISDDNKSPVSKYTDRVATSSSQGSQSKLKRLKKTNSRSENSCEDEDSDIDWNDELNESVDVSTSSPKHASTSQKRKTTSSPSPRIPQPNLSQSIRATEVVNSPMRKRLVKMNKRTSDDSDSDSDIDWNDTSAFTSPNAPAVSTPMLQRSKSPANEEEEAMIRDLQSQLQESVAKKRHFIDWLRPLTMLFTSDDADSFSRTHNITTTRSDCIICADNLLRVACEKGATKTALLILSLTKHANVERTVQSAKDFFASLPNNHTSPDSIPASWAVDFTEVNNPVCYAVNALKSMTDLSAAKELLRRHKSVTSRRGAAQFSHEVMFEPIKLAFQHLHYGLISALCVRSPLYVMLFLQSSVLLPAWSSPDRGEEADENGATEGFQDVEETPAEDPERYPCAMFQLIQGDWSLGLSLALRALDEQLCALTRQQQSKTRKPGSVYELRTDAIRKLVRTADTSDGSTIVHWAAEEDSSVCLGRLLELDPTLISVTDRHGLTPLHCACVMGSLACVDLLLRSPLHTAGMTLQAEKNGWTPFLYAIYREQVPCALRLLQRNASDIRINSMNSGVVDLQSSDGDAINESAPTASLFDRYDYDNALSQLLLLGRIVQVCSRGDARVRSAMETLSTVPEFRQLVNAILRAHMDRIDEELGFLLLHPSLLDMESKLLVLKKACLQLHETAYANVLMSVEKPYYLGSKTNEMEDGELFPILSRRSSRDHTPKLDIKLPRQNPWRGLVETLRRRLATKVSCEAEDMVKGTLLRRRLIFTFTGADEKGHGPGVEKELFETMSRCLVASTTRPTVALQLSGGKSVTGFGPSVIDVDYTLFTPLSNDNKPASSNLHEPIDLSPIVKQPSKAPIPSASVPFQDHQKLQMFEFFGQLLAHLVLRAVGADYTHDEDSVNRAASNLLSINLSEVFWKLILGREVRLADLESSDPSLHGNLKLLLDSTGVEDFTLYFTAGEATSSTATSADTGAGKSSVRVMELIPGGADVLVTDKNKHKYVSAMIQTVVARLQRQAAAIRRGLVAVLPEAALNLFAPTDLSVLLSGATEIDVDDWRAHTSYGEDCVMSVRSIGSASVVRWFWALVKTLTATERALLLRFCTGSSKLPVGGFGFLNPPFQINFTALPSRLGHPEKHRSGGGNSNSSSGGNATTNPAAPLPTAATCFNLLRLPLYESEGQLRKQVMTALVYGSEGFSFV